MHCWGSGGSRSEQRGRSYCVLHAKQAAGNAKIEAFRSWIMGAPQIRGPDLSPPVSRR